MTYKVDLSKIPTTLETKRLWLNKYKNGEGKKFFNLMQHNHDRLKNTFPISLAASDSMENAESWIQRKVTGWMEGTMFSFAIHDKGSGAFIGDSIIKNVDWTVPKAELGYFITKEFEGKGLMQEVLCALHEFAFTLLGLEKLYLKISTTNLRSCKLAERCGYSLEGTLKQDYRTADGFLSDICYYGLTKDNYWREKDSRKS